MANKMRDRLINSIETARDDWWEKSGHKQTSKASADYIADCLIDDGWIRLPCKVGDTVYCIEHKTIHECIVTLVKSLTYENETIFFVEAECEIISPFYSDGRKIKHGITAVWEIEWGSWYRAFPTKAEAEQKLKEMRGVNDL